MWLMLLSEGKIASAKLGQASHFSGLRVIRIMKERQSANPTWTGKL